MNYERLIEDVRTRGSEWSFLLENQTRFVAQLYLTYGERQRFSLGELREELQKARVDVTDQSLLVQLGILKERGYIDGDAGHYFAKAKSNEVLARHGFTKERLEEVGRLARLIESTSTP